MIKTESMTSISTHARLARFIKMNNLKHTITLSGYFVNVIDKIPLKLDQSKSGY